MRKTLLVSAALISAAGFVGLAPAAITCARPAHSGTPAPKSATWHPVTTGLTRTPADLLPATISRAHPVRVVSTALDPRGRPVSVAHTATDRADATKLITTGQHAHHALSVELDGTVQIADAPTGDDP